MTTLPLADIETAVSAAFDHWLDQDAHDFSLTLSGHQVLVTIRLVDDRFNCGIPGFNMGNSDQMALRQWVPTHIEKNGIKGQLAPCKDGAVNVWLKGGVYIMFNFHVNLVSPC